MIVKIYVNENRTFSGANRGFYFGTTFENDVTTLKFIIPDSLNYLTERYLLLASGADTFKLGLNDYNEVVIPQYVTTQDDIQIQLVLKDAKSGNIWRSATYDATFYSSLDEGSGDPIEVAKKQQREIDRLQLSETLAQLTESDLSDQTWDELIEKTKTLPLKTEQDVVDLTDYTALTYAFEHATTAPSLIMGGYKLDKEEPDDPDSPDVLIKLPFLETPNAVYSKSTRVSQSVEECGFSVKGSAKTIAGNERSMFNSLGGAVAANLKKLTLADSECVIDPRGMFNDCGSIEEITLIERGNNAEEYHAVYWYEFFRNCSNLQSILGTPLDMSRGTAYTRTFQKCSKLRYVRFKPLTISHDLDLSDCPALMKGKYGASSDDSGTLLSIVNGVREYTSGMNQITIKFSTFVKDYLTSWRCIKDDETGLYIASAQGMTLATVLTNNKGVIIA